MAKTRLLCVDSYEGLEKVVTPQMNMFYCKNIKCRRFGVLTIGGLLDSICDKRLIIEDEEKTGEM
jgi:hypothetical protein